MDILVGICRSLEYFFLTYLFFYNTVNFVCILLAFREVRRNVIAKGYGDLDMIMDSPLTPPISIIVPCYNEEITIVETINSLINLQFPRIELIIVNDGSTDGTLEIIKSAFPFRRIEIDEIERITTSPVREYYEAETGSYDRVIRFVLIDKENGGSKADALNAGINVSRCPYFVAIDADTIIDDAALLQAFRTLLDSRNTVAIGGQIAISNGCLVENGRVTDTRLPKSWIVRFQSVEYIRAFTLARSAFSRMRSLLIISGGFGIFEKKSIIKIGGYLTRHLTSKLAREYANARSNVLGEDLELIVRLHRYIREKKLPLNIAYQPHRMCWTQVPDTLDTLSRQRNRWQRGLMETLSVHRKMILNRSYGRIGMFGLPYLIFYELLGPYIECLGYLTLPILYYAGGMDFTYVLLFFIVSVFYGVLISVSSIIISAWPEKTSETGASVRSLINFKGVKEIFILFFVAIMENFGYRQLTAWWRVRALFDYFKSNDDWDKFERTEYMKAPVTNEQAASRM